MALTSEEVVRNGEVTLEHVNKLGDEMIVFLKRLDGISDVFEDMQDQMDAAEDEITEKMEGFRSYLTEEATSQINEMGELIENEVKEKTDEALEQFKSTLAASFDKVDASSAQVVERWTDWRDTEMSENMNNYEEMSGDNNTWYEGMIEKVTSDIELIGQIAEKYTNVSVEMGNELSQFVNEALEGLNEQKESYSQIMLGDFMTELENGLTQGTAMLSDIQAVSTGAVFEQMGEDFADHVRAKLVPLIDTLVESVANAVEKMMSDIERIGNENKESSDELDVMTESLEQLISPIKSIIDRTQSIKNVVDVFI